MFHINRTPHIRGAFWSCLFIYGTVEVLHFPLFPVRNNGGLNICRHIFVRTCFWLFLGIVFLAHVVAMFSWVASRLYLHIKAWLDIPSRSVWSVRFHVLANTYCSFSFSRDILLIVKCLVSNLLNTTETFIMRLFRSKEETNLSVYKWKYSSGGTNLGSTVILYLNDKVTCWCPCWCVGG